MNLDDKIISVRAKLGDLAEVAERAQAIKFIMRRGKNWDAMSIPNKEALEHIATWIGTILSGDMNESDNWNNLAATARMRGTALDGPKTYRIPGMDAAEASIDDDIRTVAGKFAPRT